MKKKGKNELYEQEFDKFDRKAGKRNFDSKMGNKKNFKNCKKG